MRNIVKIGLVLLVVCALLACGAVGAVPAGEDPPTEEVVSQPGEAPGDDLWDRLIRVEESVWE